MALSLIRLCTLLASLLSVGECQWWRWKPPVPSDPDTEVIFRGNTGVYAGFRLPAVVYHQNYFLAFCEGRIDGLQDSSLTHIVMKRGQRQSGTTVVWDEELTVVVNIPGKRLANPVPIVDTGTNTILLVYNVMTPGEKSEEYLQKESYTGTQVLHMIKSTDVGETWSAPVDITQQTLGAMDPVPVFFAPGPGHGIQMKSGRLVLQGNFHERDTNPSHETFRYGLSDHSVVFLSDNNGLDWRPGGFVPYGENNQGKPIHTNEATVVEFNDDTLCMNSRTSTKKPILPRAQSFSSDGGETFGQPELAQELKEPQNTGITAGCAASMVGFPAPNSSEDDNKWVLFSNPAHQYFRRKLSIRLSKDGCQTWSDPWTIWSLASGYSDIVYIDDESTPQFAVLYERGTVSSTMEVAFRMFTLDDVLNGI